MNAGKAIQGRQNFGGILPNSYGALLINMPGDARYHRHLLTARNIDLNARVFHKIFPFHHFVDCLKSNQRYLCRETAGSPMY